MSFPAEMFRRAQQNIPMIEHYGRQLTLLQEIIPQAWQLADRILTGLLPDYLIKRINSSENVGHGLQHISRVWHRFIVDIVHNPRRRLQWQI